jgi:hypothetical protein
VSGQIDVVTEAMRSHAGKLDALASDAVQGVEAGKHVLTNGDAYGKLCSFIGGAMVPAQLGGIANAALTVASLKATAVQVRSVAATFDKVDEIVNDAMKAFEG